eukprot:m51a1_g4174 putative monoacylglycerol oacyltransferase (315) ;mRNA; f:341810-343358
MRILSLPAEGRAVPMSFTGVVMLVPNALPAPLAYEMPVANYESVVAHAAYFMADAGSTGTATLTSIDAQGDRLAAWFVYVSNEGLARHVDSVLLVVGDALAQHHLFTLRILLWASRAEIWDKVFPGIDTRHLVASALLALPGLRAVPALGCVNASRKVASRILAETKLSLLLYPGGEREQLETQHGRHRIYVSGRRGFLRLALQNGTPVVPCYIFGVVDEFATTSFAHGLRAWVQKRFAVALPLFWGTALLPWVPRQVPVTAVFGEAIEVGPPVAEPTDEQIAQLQKRYIEALTSVFDRCKAELATEDTTLEVV